MTRRTTALILFAGLLGFGLYEAGYLGGGNEAGEGTTGRPDPVIALQTGDAAMAQAVAQVRMTLPVFLANTTQGNVFPTSSPNLKVSFDLGLGSTEVIWVSPVQWDGEDQFAGLLANQPNYLDLNMGDRVEFSADMINDWAFIAPDGTLYGQYTTRVLLSEMEENMAALVAARLSDDPVPAGWQ